MTVLKNAVTVIITVAVFLLLLEEGLRAFNGLPLWPDQNFILARANITREGSANVYDPVLGWVLKPGLAAAQDRRESSFTTGEFGVRMNRAGIRPVPRGAILAVGDSFAAGSEVGDADSWPASLERQLGEPVVNAATGAWASDQIVLRAEGLIANLAPKTIVVSFLDQDVLRAEFSVYGGGSKPYFLVEEGRLVPKNHPVPKFGEDVANASRGIGLTLAVLGYSHLMDWTMTRLGVDWWLQVQPYLKAPNDPAQVSCLLLERLKRETAARGIRLIFILQWGGNEISQWDSRPAYAVNVLTCAAQSNIQTIDTWDPLRAVFAQGPDKLKALYVMHQDNTLYGHMSAKGNRFVADLIATALKSTDKHDGIAASHP